MRSTAFFALALAAVSQLGQAESLLITNPGFEDISGESPFNEFTFGPLNGWNLYDPGNITSGGAGPSYFIGTLTPQPDPGSPGNFVFFPDGAPQGSRVGIAFNFAGTGGTGEYGFVQTLSSTLQAQTQYTLQVDIGNIASGTAVDNTFYNLNGFPGYRVDLLAGSTVIAQDLNSLAGTLAEGRFATSTVTFTTGVAPDLLGQALAIRLVNLNLVDPAHPSADLEVDFDNVRLDALAIPEPSSGLLLLGTGALALAARRLIRTQRPPSPS